MVVVNVEGAGDNPGGWSRCRTTWSSGGSGWGPGCAGGSEESREGAGHGHTSDPTMGPRGPFHGPETAQEGQIRASGHAAPSVSWWTPVLERPVAMERRRAGACALVGSWGEVLAADPTSAPAGIGGRRGLGLDGGRRREGQRRPGSGRLEACLEIRRTRPLSRAGSTLEPASSGWPSPCLDQFRA